MVPGLLVYRFDAPLFFANATVLREEVLALVDASDPPVREVVIDAAGIVDMDVTGAEALDAARASRDARFAQVLSVCSFVVDGDPVGGRDTASVSLVGVELVDVLPPFAGG